MAGTTSKKAKMKISQVLAEFRKGKLKSSSGEEITSFPQALAIAFSEARKRGSSHKDEDEENSFHKKA